MKNQIQKSIDTMKEGREALRKVALPTEWELEKLQDCVKGLFTFAKFKVGDLVEMNDTYPVNVKDSWGWMSIRHLLKKGSKAKIIDVDWYKDNFLYIIQFLDNTWIDDNDVIRPVIYDDHTNIHLSEKWLKLSKKSKKSK